MLYIDTWLEGWGPADAGSFAVMKLHGPEIAAVVRGPLTLDEARADLSDRLMTEGAPMLHNSKAMLANIVAATLLLREHNRALETELKPLLPALVPEGATITGFEPTEIGACGGGIAVLFRDKDGGDGLAVVSWAILASDDPVRAMHDARMRAARVARVDELHERARAFPQAMSLSLATGP